MHELSIAQGIVDIIRQYVPEEQTADVRRVRIRVGQMAGIVPDSLDFCFGAIVNGTPMGEARLDIEETPVRSQCGGCGEAFTVEGAAFLCPFCGSREIKIISGTELQVIEIELSDRQAGAV
jgi:hydrogenase nickel incorporation protein HypA/HybF